MPSYLRHNGVFITRIAGKYVVTETPPAGATIVQLGTEVTITGGTASVPTAKMMKPVEISSWARGVVDGTYVERGPVDEDYRAALAAGAIAPADDRHPGRAEWPGIVRVEVCVLVDEVADRRRQKLIGTRVWARPEDVRVPALEESTTDRQEITHAS